MSDDPPRAPSIAEPRRKFQRALATASRGPFDMGSAGALSMMKTEAKSIATTGPAHVLKDYPANLLPLLHNYLSATVATAHKDQTGEAHAEHNRAILEALPPEVKELESATGTTPLSFNQEWCVNVYCKLVDHLKKGSDDLDHMPKFFLDYPGTSTAQPETLSRAKSGGFAQTYEHINVTATELNKCDQDRCIFRCQKTTFEKIVPTYGTNLIEEASGFVEQFYGTSKLRYVDVLFNWNKHSFFTYHQDHDGDLSVIINLTHGEASMHVAGMEDATYHGIGSGHLFPGKLFHRSGAAPRRCVKLAMFFQFAAGRMEMPRSEGHGGNPSSVTMVPPSKGGGEASTSGAGPSTTEGCGTNRTEPHWNWTART